ncbi:MAG: hypothetical protein ACPGQL_02170 [Thermoplasmatota archaeon]
MRSLLAGLAFLALLSATSGLSLVPAADAAPSVLPEAEAPACPDVARLDGIGRACRQADGILQLFDEAGDFLGWSHGQDPIPDPQDVTRWLPGIQREPYCVDRSIPYDVEPRAVVIYARAHDDADGYAAWKPRILNMVNTANGMVHLSGAATDGKAALKVECANDRVLVHEAVLPTDRAAAGFNSIASDLRDMGFGDAGARHWIFYDDRGACSCGGMGNLILDDTPTPANLNNGFLFTAYAITFGYDSARIMLHELGHNMGAVQMSAPHTTGAGHCTDGRDIMCYRDGGPQSHRYTNNRCGQQVWDCGHDDYFDASPDPDEYLASHWNLGSRFNRFIRFGDAIDTPVIDVGLTA